MKSAKKWLEEEHFYPEEVFPDKKGYAWKLHTVMERFANNRTKELQASILEFRQILSIGARAESKEGEEAEYWRDLFDRHFGITEVRNEQN